MLVPRPCQPLLFPKDDGAGEDDGLLPKPPKPKGDVGGPAVEPNIEDPNPVAGAWTAPKGDGAGAAGPKLELVATSAGPKPDDCPPSTPNGLGAAVAKPIEGAGAAPNGLGVAAGAKPAAGDGIPNPDACAAPPNGLGAVAGTKPAAGGGIPNPDACAAPPNGLGVFAGAKPAAGDGTTEAVPNNDDCAPPKGDGLGAAAVAVAKGEDDVPEEELILLTGVADAVVETPKFPFAPPPKLESENADVGVL